MTNYVYKNDLPADLNLGNLVAIDTETLGLNIHRDRLCVVQLSSGDGNAHLVQFDKDKYDAPNLKKLLSDPKVVKIFHFARFDVAVMKLCLGVDVKNIYCTRTASRFARTYTDSHGLKILCEEYLAKDISKKQQSSYWGADKLNEKQIDYAANDVLFLHQLKTVLDENLARENRLSLAMRAMEVIALRAELDVEGWPDDIWAH